MGTIGYILSLVGVRRRLALAGLVMLLVAYAAARTAMVYDLWCMTGGCLRRLGVVSPLQSPLLVYGIMILGGLAGLTLRRGLLALPLLVWSTVAGLVGVADLPGLVALLAVMPLGALYWSWRGSSRHEASWSPWVLLPVAVFAGIAAGSGLLLGLLSTRLPELVLDEAARLGGDLGLFIESMDETFIFMIIVLMLTLYIAFKSYEAIVSLGILAAARPPRLFEIEALGQLEEWNSNLVDMRGKQYPALREGQILVFSFLFGPIFLPIVRALLLGLDLPGGNLGTALYLLGSYALAWLATRLVHMLLFDHPPVSVLLEPPRPAIPLILGLAVGGIILVIAAAAGAEPVRLLIAAVTGDPARAGNPLYDVRGLDRNTLLFVEIARRFVELLVRLLWGG